MLGFSPFTVLSLSLVQRGHDDYNSTILTGGAAVFVQDGAHP